VLKHLKQHARRAVTSHRSTSQQSDAPIARRYATVRLPRFRGNVTVMHDDETQRVLRNVAGGEHNIPERLRGRLRGDTIGDLRKDAQQLAKELGIVEPQPRDAHGRYASSMDELIRHGIGR
jgi:hypothetical protein